MPATIIIPGRLTKDCEIRQAGSSQVVSFSVAVNCFERKEKLTRYYDCSWFGQRAVSASKMLTRGAAVSVTGAHSTREHNGKTYEQCDVWNVEFQGGGKRTEGQPAAAPQTSGGGFDDADYGPGGDDQMPF